MNERMSGEALLAAAARGVKGGLVRLQLGQARAHWSPDGGFLALLDCAPETFARAQGEDWSNHGRFQILRGNRGNHRADSAGQATQH